MRRLLRKIRSFQNTEGLPDLKTQCHSKIKNSNSEFELMSNEAYGCTNVLVAYPINCVLEDVSA